MKRRCHYKIFMLWTWTLISCWNKSLTNYCMRSVPRTILFLWNLTWLYLLFDPYSATRRCHCPFYMLLDLIAVFLQKEKSNLFLTVHTITLLAIPGTSATLRTFNLVWWKTRLIILSAATVSIHKICMLWSWTLISFWNKSLTNYCRRSVRFCFCGIWLAYTCFLTHIQRRGGVIVHFTCC